MDRRTFLHSLGVTAAAAESLDAAIEAFEPEPQAPTDTTGFTPIAEFEGWKVLEDLRTRDGAIVFTGPAGKQRVLGKSAEASFPTAEPPYLGLKIADIGMAGKDLLADKLLEHGGDPDPEQVHAAAPPLGSPNRNGGQPGARLPWGNFVGTRECFDTMPVFPAGNTRTYHPSQYFPELTNNAAGTRFEGLLGGWMPAVRKVFPLGPDSHIELIVFGDVEAKDKFIVQTWHRSAKIENGKITKVVYGYSYPAYPPHRVDPKPEAFYRALLKFADYWDKQVADVTAISIPDERWTDMTKHAVVKEL